MKKCFRAPGRVIFLCNESGFCQRKEPARSEDRRAVSFQEQGPARRAAPCARDPRSLRALIRSRSRLAGAPPRALTSGELRSPSAPPLRAARGEQRGPATSPPRPQVRPPPRAPFRGQPGPRPARGWGSSAAGGHRGARARPRQRGRGKAPRERRRRRRGAAHRRARGPGQLPARPRAHLPQAAQGARRAGLGPAGKGRLAAVPAPAGATGVRSPRCALPAVSARSPPCPATAPVPLPPRGCCGDFRQAQIAPNARAKGVDTHRLIRSCENQKNLLNHHSRK
ncbi:uncharacterized protein LOC141731034 [Zonotrichia albicollis]|uniref:uncharacterized protein LOC141731034 n=1 Tax=Zonotrichia albicollis TaxID=44394 RepID=UPI003D81012C